MSVREILRWPDTRLGQVCEPVRDLAAIDALVDDLFETMYAAAGRGLAAPQVGVALRVFVMDVGWRSGPRTPVACINPRVLHRSDALRQCHERCLSVPGITVALERPRWITLAFSDQTGALQQRRMTGDAALCAQHELDHLDGLLHLDRLGARDRAAVLGELAEQG